MIIITMAEKMGKFAHGQMGKVSVRYWGFFFFLIFEQYEKKKCIKCVKENADHSSITYFSNCTIQG